MTPSLNGLVVGLTITVLAAPGVASSQPRPPVVNPDVGAAPLDRGVARPPTGVAPTAHFYVEAIEFRAHNETGIDFLGSDEVIPVFDTARYRVVGGEYGDVDGGETFPIRSQQACITPATDPGPFDGAWSCIEAGAPGPVSFDAALYEFDGTDFLPPGGFCVRGGRTTDLLAPRSGTCDIDNDVSKLIGRQKVEMSAQELLAAMPRPGDTYVGNVALFGGCDGDCVSGGVFGPSPDYTLTYRITRAGNQVVEPPRDPTPR